MKIRHICSNMYILRRQTKESGAHALRKRCNPPAREIRGHRTPRTDVGRADIGMKIVQEGFIVVLCGEAGISEIAVRGATVLKRIPLQASFNAKYCVFNAFLPE